MLQVLRFLDEYMPHRQPQDWLPIAVHGDVASVEMMAKVKTESGHEVTVAGLPSVRNSFKCVHPVPGEFHKRMLQLDDTLKTFKTAAPPQRGTLENFRTVTGTRNVSSPVSYVMSK